MSAALDCDVLVVGAGPTGMALGLLLAQRNVRTIVIDKEADIYPLPRAAHIDHETVRIFQELGLADAILTGCRSASRYDFLTAKGEVLLRFEGMGRIGPGGWPAGNMIHQPSIEALMRQAAAREPRLQLRTSKSFVSYTETDAGVTTTASTADGSETITSRFLVGADGARSPVRAAANIAFDDLGFDEPWLVVDALVHDESRLPEANLQICDPARPTTCVLMGKGRHRWEFMLKPGEDADTVSQDAFIAALLKPWNVEGAISIERKAVYRFNAKVATQWRKRGVMLAGDAAHLMPPFAGQGMCSGLRDAANLAWKLAAILHGADAALLDTYQTEREPNVRGIIAMAMMMGKTVCITDPVTAQARDEAMLAARAQGHAPDGAVSYPPLSEGCLLSGSAAAGSYFPQLSAAASNAVMLDDVLGKGPWLLCREVFSESVQGVARITLDGDELSPFRAQLDQWLAAHAAEAVLVRPDRYVFGAGEPRALVAAWQTWIATQNPPTPICG